MFLPCPNRHQSGHLVTQSGGRACFWDLDGTLIQDVPRNTDPDRVRLLPDVTEWMRALSLDGWRQVIVTNKGASAVKGGVTHDQLATIHERVLELLAVRGIFIDGVYYCPHYDRSPGGADAEWNVDQCPCRKPRPGMLFAARDDLGLELDRCWMVGDMNTDAECGRSVGCRTLLIDHGSIKHSGETR